MMNNPYEPPSARSIPDASERMAKPSVFWILAARATLVICALAVVRTFPSQPVVYEVLSFCVALLSLLLFTTIVFLDLHRRTT